MPRPEWVCGAYKTAWGNVGESPILGSATLSNGFIIEFHSCSFIVVASIGYSRVFNMVVWMACQVSERERLLFCSFVANDLVFCRRLLTCALLFPSIDR